MNPFFELIPNQEFMNLLPPGYEIPLFEAPVLLPPIQPSPRIHFYMGSQETTRKSLRKKKDTKLYIKESEVKKKILKKRGPKMIHSPQKKMKILPQKEVKIKETIEEKFIQKMKDRSRINYLPDPSPSSVSIPSIKMEFAYQDKPNSFDQTSLRMPRDTPIVIKDLAIHLLRNARNKIEMTNQCYDFMSKILFAKIYSLFEEKKDEWVIGDHTHIGEELMKMVHENDHFSFMVNHNTQLYGLPFCFFMKMYFLHIHIDEKIPSYVIPPDMDHYRFLIQQMKIFFQHQGMKARAFGIGLLFRISIMMTEEVDTYYSTGGAPTQATVVRENMIREIFDIKKFYRKSH